MTRRPPIDPRKAKVHRNYTIADAAKLFQVHRNTVRSWIRAGLETFKAPGCVLILGCELRAFLTARQASRKRPLARGQLYCMSCREPRYAATGSLQLVDRRGTTGNVRGMCTCCRSVMHRRISLQRLRQDGFGALADGEDSHLVDSPSPSVNCPLHKAA